MAKKKNKLKKQKTSSGQKTVERFERPRVGQFVTELIGGGHGHARRYRRIDEHPLTLAYYRGQLGPPHSAIATDRYTAGEIMRRLCEKLFRSGRDCTDFLPSSGGGQNLPWTEEMASSIRQIQRIQSRMSPHDYVIVRKFCGEGYGALAALRAANIVFDPRDTRARLCAALDNLVFALSGGAVRSAA